MNLRLSLGDSMVRKLIGFVVASATSPHTTTSPLEVLEVAGLVLEHHPTESVKDLVMAFKRAKLKGQVPPGLPLAALVFQVLGSYLDEKSRYLEQRHREFLNHEAADEYGVLRAIQENKAQNETTEEVPANHRIGRRYRKAG
jgi:hypothetical protein